MSVVDHYIGAKEYSILSKTYLNYHKYTPYEYIDFDNNSIPNLAKIAIKNYYNFFADLEANKGFLKNAIFKTNSSGLWVTENTNQILEAFHAYFSYDYKNLIEQSINNFYENVAFNTEPEKLKYLRQQELDIGIEGISISLSGKIQKYITLFRPNSPVLSYFPELENIDKIQHFVDLNYENIKNGLNTDPNSFRSPIRIQFDANDDQKISIELVSSFFQKEYYLNKNSYSGYIKRKELYFERMAQANLLSSEEILYCRENSPSWQQFSVKFKWQNGKIVDKKLYTFVVVDFEEIE